MAELILVIGFIALFAAGIFYLRKAEAEIKRLRELLSEARDDIRCEVENRIPAESRHYPAEMRRYQSDMDLVHRIDAALGAEPHHQMRSSD